MLLPSPQDNRNQTDLWLVTVFCTLLLSNGCGDGGNSNPPTTRQQTNDRIARKHYDFDHNGIYEGLSEFLYDSSGRVVEERYTYTDDGTPDLDTRGTDITKGAKNSVTSYYYGVNDLLESWTKTTDEGSRIITYTYNSSHYIVRSDVITQNRMGGIELTSHHLLEYEDQRLVRHTTYSESDPLPSHTYEIHYDDKGRINNHQITLNPPQIAGHTTYSYLSNGQLETIFKKPPYLPVTSEYMYTFTYNNTGQLTQFSLTNILNERDTRFGWAYQYGNDGMISESWLDNHLDDSIDTIVMTEWEQAPCTPVLFWEADNIVSAMADSPSPFLSGTGYRHIPVCSEEQVY